jgi:hypothetical protein
MSDDITLQSKKELIEHYMGCIKRKMLRIKDNASKIQKEITDTMQAALD